MGQSAGLRRATAQQRDLQQRPQHRRRQQRDEHRDDYESERPDADHAAGGSHGAGGAADRGVDAGGAGATSSARSGSIRSRGAGARGLARAIAAAFGRTEGRHATAPEPAGRSAAERARVGCNSTAAATGPAAARDERAAAAAGNWHVSDWHVGDADNAFGRDHAGHAIGGAWKRQARDDAVARARSQTGDTDNAVSRDHAGNSAARTRRQCQARNVGLADASGNDALGRGHAGDVNTGGRRTCQAQDAAVANAGRQAVDHDAFGGDHASGAITGAGRKPQARNVATNAGCQALHTDNAFRRDYAGHAIAGKQAGNANASARCKTSDTAIAADAGQAGHGLAFTAARERYQARNAAATNSRRTSGTAACKANCAGGCRRGPAASGGAQGCATATKGVSGWQDHGGRERSARLQIDQLARNSSF